MITSTRMAAVDANAAALGVSTEQLMETSGNAVAREVRNIVDTGATIAIVAGRGNNGGDAFVSARFLSEYQVAVYLLGRPETITTSIARGNWETLSEAEYDINAIVDSKEIDFGTPEVIIDGIFGTGFTGVPREPERSAIESINATDAITIAVDVPSGMNADTGDVADTAVSADHIVTFHDLKPGLESSSGVTVADIGIPPAAESFVGPGDLQLLRRHLRGNKREDDTGRIFVIGGGPYTGAPALSAQAALRAGADLSFIAAPELVSNPIQGYSEDLIVQSYPGTRLVPDHVDSLVETATRYDDIVVIGPGLGDADETRDAVQKFLNTFDGKAVVDADALAVVPQVETEATLVLTPNQHEVGELGGPTIQNLRAQTEDIEILASKLGHTLLVKAREAVITDGERTRIVREGTPGMTVGGTGDVLSGLVAAFFGVAPPIEAACGAAYVKGLAGKHLAEEFGAGFIASDLLKAIPAVLWPTINNPALRGPRSS